MHTCLLFVLLQLNLLGPSSQPLTGTKIYLENAAMKETVAFVKIGQSGEFEFSNLDPGNYLLYIELEDYTVKKVDKKDRQKFDTDIEIAFNKDKSTFCWHRSDGFMKLDIDKKTKIAETLLPSFDPIKSKTKQQDKESADKDENDAKNNKKEGSTPIGKIKILQFTVIDAYGSISGEISSISQKEFHKLVVGNDDITLEDAGEVQVIKRMEDD